MKHFDEIVDTWLTWLTPSVLFCIINLMIVTIFLLKPHEKLKKLTQAQHLAQLVRVPLIFQRVLSNRSIENQPVHHETFHAANKEPVHVQERKYEPGLKKTEPVHKQTRIAAHAEPVPDGTISHVRSKSEMVHKKPVKKVLRKSFSENKTEKTTTSSRGDEAVDEKANDFISKFRKALKLQRVDSVNLMYSEMMSRGT